MDKNINFGPSRNYVVVSTTGGRYYRLAQVVAFRDQGTEVGDKSVQNCRPWIVLFQHAHLQLGLARGRRSVLGHERQHGWRPGIRLLGAMMQEVDCITCRKQQINFASSRSSSYWAQAWMGRDSLG